MGEGGEAAVEGDWVALMGLGSGQELWLLWLCLADSFSLASSDLILMRRSFEDKSAFSSSFCKLSTLLMLSSSF